MNSKELAERFVRSFCSADLEALSRVLADSLRFQGPLLESSSSAEYLAALRGNLDPDPSATILASFGEGDRAAVFYTYRGNTIGQLFSCSNGRIHETTLIFDTKHVV